MGNRSSKKAVEPATQRRTRVKDEMPEFALEESAAKAMTEGGQDRDDQDPLPEPQVIKFDGNATPSPNELRSILNPHLEGYLVQRYWASGDPGFRVFRTPSKNVPNKDNVKVRVYSYTSIPPADGTYVVLQFKKSTMYFTFDENEPGYPNLQLPKDFEPEYPKNAEHINTTADPRVFLMKQPESGGDEYMFASCVASQQQPGDKSKAKVITLAKNEMRWDLFRLEGKGPSLESQWFQIVPPPCATWCSCFGC